MMGEDVQKDAPDGADDSERAAQGAFLKDGVKQTEQDVSEEVHKPVAEDPGEPKGRSSDTDQPDAEQRGDVPDHPDYSSHQVKETDPSHSELNKGPSAVTCESFEAIESQILTMLSESGLTPGSEQWKQMYEKGFARAIADRASVVAERYESMPDFINKKVDKDDDSDEE